MCLELRFNVENIDKWRTNFEQNTGLRKEHGSRGALAFTNPDSPNDVTIVIKGMNKANMAKANEDGSFKKAMKESGIVGEPNMQFLTYVTELDS